MRIAGPAGDFGYVFVVSYGRSGSTLLMGLLNAIPGYRIRGENYNTLYRLYQADAAVAKACEKFAGTEDLSPQSSWYGTPRIRAHGYRADLIAAFVNNVLRPERGDRVLGFKEIRYTPLHMTDLDAYLTFLLEAFPRARIIINHRDPAAVARSAWWADVRDAETKIRDADERLLAIPADDRHFHFFYDEIDESLDNIRALHRFLGEKFDAAAVRQVLGTRYSPYPAAAQTTKPASSGYA
ncbi:sulfotransferase family protein [Actinoplanes aureus]|uniref:Sulfotransferase n=1 Tax=Actinoplanes aureus TaxID=2792083 RepID=A0A931CAW5_9ACTN|nr:sulfotransferase [Actinoplanes aureus]MBG0564021.1 sulfotransferase [Actinoplanes aureus]